MQPYYLPRAACTGLSWSEVLHVSPAPKWWFATCLPPGCSPRIENMLSGRSLTTEIPELEESAAHSCSYLVETTYFTLILFFLSAHWGILLLQEPVLFLHLMESFTEDLCIFLGSKNTEMLQKCRWKHFSRTIFRILFCLTDVLHFCCPKHSWEGRQQEGRSLVHPDMIKSVGIVLTTHHMMRQRQHTRLNPCSLQLHKGVGMLASQADQNHIHSYPRPTFLLCTQRIRPGLNAGGILAIPSAIQHWRKKKKPNRKKKYFKYFLQLLYVNKKVRSNNHRHSTPQEWFGVFFCVKGTSLCSQSQFGLIRSSSPCANWASEKHPWVTVAYTWGSLTLLCSKLPRTFHFLQKLGKISKVSLQ